MEDIKRENMENAWWLGENAASILCMVEQLTEFALSDEHENDGDLQMYIHDLIPVFEKLSGAIHYMLEPLKKKYGLPYDIGIDMLRD